MSRISEERLQLLLPRNLKTSLRRAAHRDGLSIGEYIRRLVEIDLRKAGDRGGCAFPFGLSPIHTGRKRGSISRHAQDRD